MHPDHWNPYFSEYQGQTLLTLRTPKATDRQEAYSIVKKIVYDLAAAHDLTPKQIAAIGVYCGSTTPSERHLHLLIDSDSPELAKLDNRKNPEGKRPRLPLKRYHPALDHVDALEISPIEDRQAVNSYLSSNYNSHPATDILKINTARLEANRSI